MYTKVVEVDDEYLIVIMWVHSGGQRRGTA